MVSVRVAKRYAAALMDVALERKALDTIARDMELVGSILTASRELRLVMASPVVSPAKKKAVLQELFGPRLAKETLAFLDLLLRKNREAALPAIVEQFLALRDEKLGLIRVDVTTAVAFPRDRENHLKERLERYTGQTVKLRFGIDVSLKAGMVVKIGDTVLDGSLMRQLARLRERLIEGEPLSN